MLPLEGIRVLDLSRLLPGPAATWHLYGLGAEVVKVEDPSGGDYMRHIPPLGPDGVGVWYAVLNGGKRSVALDLRSKAGVGALRAMLPRFDVLVESFRPGVLARLGLDPAELIEAHPRLIVASITSYGQAGPLSKLPGHDLGFMGLAGALSTGARTDGVPSLPGFQVADMAGGALTAALGVTAALVGRGRTGRGQWLDLSMTEGAMALVAHQLAEASLTGANPTPGGETLTGALPSYGLYRCADGGVIAVAAIEPKFWAALQAAAGGTLPLERAALAALFATRPRDAWVELCGQACVTPVLELTEVLDHPQHAARGAFVDAPTGRVVRPPFLGARAGEPVAPLGAHTAEELTAAGVDPRPHLEAL